MVRDGQAGERVEWRLATPLGAAYMAFFAAPLLLLAWISFYEDNELTRLGPGQWLKFLSDPFYVGVVSFLAVCALSRESAVAVNRAPNGLIADLIAGKVPAWLRPVTAPEKTALRLWRVVR